MTYFSLNDLKSDSLYKSLGQWVINFFEFTLGLQLYKLKFIELRPN